jgi:hypothetical protein
MAGTTLTPKGWSGASSGTWNNRANVVVDNKGGIRTSGGDLIDALKGNDEIRGQDTQGPGLFVQGNKGKGDEERKGTKGFLQLGDGDDIIIGISSKAAGIENRGFIFTGAGQDQITGEGTSAIRNRRFIFMQGDDDVVDVRNGGIRGNGFIDLGGGKNTFIGFGDHQLYAGNIDKDLLLLPRGTYTIRRDSKRRYRVEKGNRELELFDFDQIGSIEGSRRDRITLDQSGTLVVRDNGSINFS